MKKTAGTIGNWSSISSKVQRKLTEHLKAAPLDDLIRKKALSDRGVFANLSSWMEDPAVDRLSPQAKPGILGAIRAGRWADIAEAFYTEIEFGTGGIRGRAVIQDNELEQLKDEGVQAAFLRGPNTFNDLVVLRISSAVARFGRDRGFETIVIGYDSRIRGRDFAHLIAGVFIAHGFKVYMFDDVVPYPEVTFAIPFLKADMGILISASHNDRRYNGYKLSCANGSQFSIADRSIILSEYVEKQEFSAVRSLTLDQAPEGRLVFLGGGLRYPHLAYYNCTGDPIDLHTEHFRHILDFVLDPLEIRRQSPNIHICYSGYNGAGGPTVKRLVDSLGIVKFDVIAALYHPDGMFPAFQDLRTRKGRRIYQQPDPGDPLAAKTAAEAYVKEYGSRRAKDVDVLIGTDPDADRTGISIPVSAKHRSVYANSALKKRGLTHRGLTLMDADTTWSLILWHYLEHAKSNRLLASLGLERDNCFLVQSHTTTDVMPLLAEKYGIGWVKTWVGFAQLATGVEKVWNRTLGETYFDEPCRSDDFKSIYQHTGIHERSLYNIAALEQSNGFSILGAKPNSEKELGRGGHVRDKDGTFAAILFLDFLAYAKKTRKSVLDLADEKLYLDKAIGLIRTGYRAAPQYGQYEGLEGRSLKMDVLRKAMGLAESAGGGVQIASRRVRRVEVYKTGKYDAQHGHTRETGYDPGDRGTYWFPDEGIRFFFEDDYNHLTIRPSGTSQSLRFHVQLRDTRVTRANLMGRRIRMESEINEILDDVGRQTGVDWGM